MKILISFLPTLFPNSNHGGSSKVIKQIAIFLGKTGDKVTIICNRRNDNTEDFYLHPNVLVKPIYRFKETVPDPYFTPPFFMKSAINILRDLSEENDVVFIFDSNFIFTDLLPQQKPIFFSLRDFLYSQALQGAFLIRRGGIIVNSEFVKQSMLATVGYFHPDLKEHIQTIHNGIDLKLFRKKRADKIKKYINLSSEDYPILLFPHRPEADKGIDTALELVEVLVKKHEFKKLKLLVTKGMDEKISRDISHYYEAIYQKAKHRGIENNILFHPWIPEDLMPEYYSIGDITLCIGDIVEAFSNTTLESLASGTNVIVNNIASYRCLFPDWVVNKVNPGEFNTLLEKALKLIKRKKQKNDRVINFLKQNFSEDYMLSKYKETLYDYNLGVKKLEYRPIFKKLLNKSVLKIAPWCFITRDGKVYNDYLKKYLTRRKKLLTLPGKEKFEYDELNALGFGDTEIEEYISLGLFVML